MTKQWVPGEGVEQDDINQAVVPTGAILAWGTDTPPAGWLLCDGAAVSEATYADLFAVIAHDYGDPGGGNFNLPNLKGKIPVGKNSAETEFDTLGETGGEKTHQLTEAELAAHHHHVNGVEAGTYIQNTASYNAGKPGDVASDDVGGDQAHNNLQPYIVLNYIIKF